jgi:tetratricopeptide (TPR) repeat protein
VSPAPYLDEILGLKRAQQWDEAVIALEEILGRSPSDAIALTHLADVQLRRHKTPEAESALDRAETLAGTTAFTARVRGDLRYREQRWRQAAASYREASVLGDRGTWPLLQLARCHLRLGELDSARGAAAEAAERDESAAAPWTLLGEIALREHHNDAVELLERAHARAPKDEYAYAKLVEARLMQLPAEQREHEVEVLLRSSAQGNRHLLGVLAQLRSVGGDEHRAAETWRARREQHGDPYARKMEAYALRRAGDLEQAAALFRACLLEDPEDMVLMRTYVHMQRSRGALEELRATLEEMIPVAGKRRGAVYGELRKLGVH